MLFKKCIFGVVYGENDEILIPRSLEIQMFSYYLRLTKTSTLRAQKIMMGAEFEKNISGVVCTPWYLVANQFLDETGMYNPPN